MIEGGAGSDDDLPARDRDGGGGHRARRSGGAEARRRGARRVSHARARRRDIFRWRRWSIYLATAPKSNSAKVALDAALEAAREHPAAQVPLHIRNAPTKLMKELGYHEGYQYAHAVPEAYIPQEYLPEALRWIGVSTSQGRSASRRRSRSGWPGGRSFAAQSAGGAVARRPARNRQRRNEHASSHVGWRSTAAIAVTAGCSALGKQAFKEPVVQLQDVRVNGVGTHGRQPRRAAERLQPERLSTRRDAADLQRARRRQRAVRRRARSTAGSRCSSNDSSMVTIPVSFTYAGLGAAGRQLLNTGAVNYRVRGRRRPSARRWATSRCRTRSTRAIQRARRAR